MSARAPRRAVLRLAVAAIPALLASMLLAACGATPEAPHETGGITGSGDVVADIRDLAPFTRVSVAADMKVIIGEASEQRVTVSAQQNLLPAIRTEVVDGQLIVTIPPPGVTATQPMSITLRMTLVESVALSGGSVCFLEHTGGPLNLDVSGKAEVTAIGTSSDLRLNATSKAHARLAELVAESAEVTLNDGASAELSVTGALTGSADGGATVILARTPALVDVTTASGATVQGG